MSDGRTAASRPSSRFGAFEPDARERDESRSALRWRERSRAAFALHILTWEHDRERDSPADTEEDERQAKEANHPERVVDGLRSCLLVEHLGDDTCCPCAGLSDVEDERAADRVRVRETTRHATV